MEKRTARVKLTLNKRTVEALEPTDRPWIAWDDKLTGFGCRVQPSGVRSFIVNYRSGDGGRNAPNKRVVIGRYGRITPDRARKKAKELLGRAASGDDPAEERASTRSLPTLGQACDEYIQTGSSDRSEQTQRGYRRYARLHFGDWRSRPLDSITRRDVETRFHLLSERHGKVTANRCLSFLRSVYRRPCVDHETLRNPVELWTAGGGRYHVNRRKQISSPATVLPKWVRGIRKTVDDPVVLDLLFFGIYTGMRRGEIMSLHWDRVDREAGLFRVEETKSGEPLELPITCQLGEILARRRTDCDNLADHLQGWVFPSSISASGHIEEIHRRYARISEAAGVKFWFHGLRNAFISVAERELMLPRSLTKRLVNHARPSDDTEGYAADWTVEQLREPAQRVADRIDQLIKQ